MTDARFPERWLNDRRIRRLNDQDFRSYVLSLVWSVSNRTDGVIEADDLDLIGGFAVSSVAVLTASGLWGYGNNDRWVITDFAATQTPREQLDGLQKRRDGDAKRARDYRARERVKKRSDKENLSRDSSRDDKGQDRPGQEQARKKGVTTESIDSVTGEVNGWSPAAAQQTHVSADISAYATQEGDDHAVVEGFFTEARQGL